MRLIAGLEEITSGDLLIDGERVNDVPPAKRGLAMVFQSYALYPHMNVADNMGFCLRLAGVPGSSATGRSGKRRASCRSNRSWNASPRSFPAGRGSAWPSAAPSFAIPRSFLFDEPLSNLDAALRVQMRLEILRLHEELRATMLYVTHDQVEAMTMADVIVVLNGGAVEQVGTPLELYQHPLNLLRRRVHRLSPDEFRAGDGEPRGESGITVALAGGAKLAVPAAPAQLSQGDIVTVGVRPEHLTLGEGRALRGEALVVERLGSATYVHVAVEGGAMITVQGGDDAPGQAA